MTPCEADRSQAGLIRIPVYRDRPLDVMADLAKFKADMLRRRPSQEVQVSVVTRTSLPLNFDIFTLHPAGQDTAAHTAQSILSAVFHNGVDAYYDLDLNPAPAKNERTDRMFSDTVAHARQMWGGDAAQGIKNLKLAPLNDSGIENRYMLNFMIDYGPHGRPVGTPYPRLHHPPANSRRLENGWLRFQHRFDVALGSSENINRLFHKPSYIEKMAVGTAYARNCWRFPAGINEPTVV